MGYHKHHTIVCTSWHHDKLNKARDKAVEIFQGECVGDLVSGTINNYKSFFIAPDGSKEDWNESDDFDMKRREFTNWMDKESGVEGIYVDYVEVCFGGDQPELNTRVIKATEYEGEK